MDVCDMGIVSANSIDPDMFADGVPSHDSFISVWHDSFICNASIRVWPDLLICNASGCVTWLIHVWHIQVSRIHMCHISIANTTGIDSRMFVLNPRMFVDSTTHSCITYSYVSHHYCQHHWYRPSHVCRFYDMTLWHDTFIGHDAFDDTTHSCTARSVEDETRNGDRNANRNPKRNHETTVLWLCSKFQVKRDLEQ